MALLERRLRWLGLELLRGARDALFPDACAVCGASEPGDGLGCAEHRLATGLAPPRCGRCASALAPALPEGATCSRCRREPPAFARALALADYASPATRDWVLAVKHGGRADLAERLGELLGARLALEIAHERRREAPREPELVGDLDGEPAGGRTSDRDVGPTRRGARDPRIGARGPGRELPRVLVPVPLHPLRALERGFDQAALLAAAASRTSGIPCLRALARSRATPPQGALGAGSRAHNVRGAFRAVRFRPWTARALLGREAWLVDDVLTSGATADECARVLKRA